MDVRECMIVDLARCGDESMFITGNIESISDGKCGLWAVKFKSSLRTFNYNYARLLYLSDPEILDLEDKGLYINNSHVEDVREIRKFADGHRTFYHVTYKNGYYEDFEGKDVYITRTRIDKNGGSTWDYLKKLAEETGLLTEDNANILSRQYDLVDLKRDNVPLAQYLGDKRELARYGKPQHVYYPFGCNASQKAAVEAALTHEVSIIQGPPGTGKTQTILNIIANLLVVNKSVLVVSNNNSAVENVAEKLSKEGLGFLVAQLGSAQNKADFIANQMEYPDMEGWKIKNTDKVTAQVDFSLNNVSQCFDNQMRQARLRSEYYALIKEMKYNESLGSANMEQEWLTDINSSVLMTLLALYRRKTENGCKPSLLFRLRWGFALGLKMFSYLKGEPQDIIKDLETSYYISRRTEIEQELKSIETDLRVRNLKQNVNNLRSSSLVLLKDKISRRYDNRQRQHFAVEDLKRKTADFLREYPVVLSTTYSAKSCINKSMVFDYVIMDEASQVDIKTGALALSCAMNAVIVGDDKQLPNVVSKEERQALNAISGIYDVDERYNAATHSFLQSCVELFNTAPVTLLREHYRCHPKIIEFCNKIFYNGELVAMTSDNNENDVLQLVRTVKGNHARGHFNQREIDVIKKEVMPEFSDTGSVGVITPYRLQAEKINEALGSDIASTVHKYQGRECDTIIMSMVDNMPTAFSDDANLMNVAISRAKTHLCVVTSGNDIPKESNLAQLIEYIKYNNFDVKDSCLHSVFDLLYRQYTEERLEYERTHPKRSDQLSENLVYDVLIKVISRLKLANTEVIIHYPLSKLIADWDLLDEFERKFASSPFAHVDFLIYNSLTKQPVQTIEVDGWKFHKESRVQQSRDALKDKILTKFGLCPHRISTTDMLNEETLIDWLSSNRNYGIKISDLNG